MMPRVCAVSAAVLALMLVAAGPAAAQQPLPPLPPTSGDSSPAPSTPNERPPPAAPADAQAMPPTTATDPTPPAVGLADVMPPVPTHAPNFALWVGGSLGAIGYGGYLYDNELGKRESTGNFVGNGLSVEANVGARLGKRYVPFVFIEHGFMGKGHRFTNSDARSSSDLYGIGFRYTAGDVDSAGFLTELSVGIRTITVSNAGQTYKMSSFEYFRLGLGAEIRISTLFTISPMAHLSGGAMDDTSGTVAYSPDGSKDGLKEPTYKNGDALLTQRGYLIVGIGCGAHFDLFGK